METTLISEYAQLNIFNTAKRCYIPAS